MDEKQAAALRAAFKPEQIGKLPKPTKRENPKGKCSECGGWHGLPAVHLDYVGHAAVTDRFIQVDPEWTWEPMARDANGFPLLDQRGGLWINLTLCGVTRPGYGDESNGRGMKEIIGDALRNAGMRFGVGLDLWSKEDLHGSDDRAPGTGASQPPTSGVSTDGVGDRQAGAAALSGGEGAEGASAAPADGDPVTAALVSELLRLSREFGANVETVQKSIDDNRRTHEGYLAKHHKWLERQIATVNANLAEREAAKAAAAKFPIPDGAKAA